MINSSVFLCKPLNFKNICTIYPPTVNQIIDNKEFQIYAAILEMTQEDLRDEYTNKIDELTKAGLSVPTPFEYVIINAYQDEKMAEIIKRGFEFFLHETVTFLPEMGKIVIGDLEEEITKVDSIDDLRMLGEENYFAFQNMIRLSMGHKSVENPEDWSNLDPRIVRFKMKARERDKVKAKQEAKNAPSLGNCLASICCMGIGLNPLNIGEISYAAVNELISTYQKKEKYGTDCTSLMLGADAKKIGFKYWINND